MEKQQYAIEMRGITKTFGSVIANKNVELRLMSAQGGDYRVLCRLFGGQGTLNVNSWSPCGKKIAFVSYRMKG